MGYTKNKWVDQVVERPKTYEMTNNADGSVTLIDSFGLVSELGTPVNADNMNHIEEGIAACDLRKYDKSESYEEHEWVTGFVDNEKSIYKSLVANNLGNPLIDATKWEKVNLGGGSNGGVSLPLLTPIFVDHVLSYEKSLGYGRCGEYIYTTAIAGERYGYPDLIKDLIAEYNSGVATTVTQGTKSVACRKSASGHYLYDIANLADVDAMFDETGVVWMYGVDIENNRIMLPKINKYFGLVNSAQLVGTYGKPGVPNINFTMSMLNGGNNKATGAVSVKTSAAQGWGDGSGQNAATYTVDASKVSPVYNESDTVQVGRANMLCYLVVGNTQQDTSWIDVVTDVNGAVKDVVDAGDEQVERINTAARSYDNLTYRNVSNCLVEVPHRIKYELTDGSLTIKAGSIVIVPYGIVDKTREFPVGSDFLNSNFKVVDCEYIRGKFTVRVELQTDLIHLPVGTYTGNGMMAINFTNNMVVQSGPLANCRSGESDSQNGSDGFYFNTTNYTITSYRDNGTVVDQNICLPFVQIHRTSGAWDNIEQVFNGMGYIGSTVWVDKGVKGLIPSGRNEDGTLKNITFTASNIIYSSVENVVRPSMTGYLTNDSTLLLSSIVQYDEIENKNIQNIETKPIIFGFPVVTFSNNNGVISDFQPYQVLQVGGVNNSQFALNYNAGIALTNGSKAPKSGMIYAINSATKTTAFLAVNGVQTGFVAGGSIVQDPTSMYGFVSQGDTITFLNCSTVTLFPFKGV